MSGFVTILRVPDEDKARVLIVALKAHGFHPLEGNAVGVPGLPGFVTGAGIGIAVPDGEAADAAILAQALLADMKEDGV